MGRIRGLGEIALRVNDLEVMTRFYEEVVGLSVLRRYEDMTFFELEVGHGGHINILALFDRGVEIAPAATTLDHFAFTIDRGDYEAEQNRLTAAGIDVFPRVFEWTGWRSLFFSDPEGNRVELVCRDPDLVPDWAPVRDRPPPVGTG